MHNIVVRSCSITIASLATLGCGDNLEVPTPPDATSPNIARGEYLARSVLGCGQCHTPYNQDGTLNQSMWLAGGPIADLKPDDDTMGLVTASNLTSSVDNGIGGWTDAEIKTAITRGIKQNGDAIFSTMPYYAYALLSEDDLDALVAYLRSLPPLENVVPPTQPLGFPVTAAPPLKQADVPDHNLPSTDPSFASAENGKYLAGIACASCHTEEDQLGHAIPTVVLQGNREFFTASFGLPQTGSGGAAEFPPITHSANLTPDATGIQGLTLEGLQGIVRSGTRPDGNPMCAMLFESSIVFATMELQDTVDLANYLFNLTPVPNDTTAGGSLTACSPMFP